jgi:RNA exonuclease 4
MVGVGSRGEEHALAQVSIVDYDGKVLLDKLVKPKEAVIDYRTSITGIRRGDLEHGREM